MHTVVKVIPAALVAAAICVGCAGPGEGGSPNGPVSGQPAHAVQAFDTSNPALVAGFATDIFVGQVSEARVLEELGPSGSNEATAQVRALDVLKGEPRDEYTVFFTPDMLVFDEASDTLRPPVQDGAVYVLATKFDGQNRDGYVVVPDAGISEVPGARAEVLTNDRPGARSAGDRSPAETEMLWGIENEVRFGPDKFPLSEPPVPPWVPENSKYGAGTNGDSEPSNRRQGAPGAEPSYATPTPTS